MTDPVMADHVYLEPLEPESIVKILEKHNTIVMNALGNATTQAVIAAESLVKNGYAEYSKLETKTVEVDQTNRRDGKGTPGDDKTVSRAKLMITLTKSKNFDKNMAKFAQIREENVKLMENEKTAREKK